MWQYQKNDAESAKEPLDPMMLESPELRWSFIRKVYSIVAVQLLLTIAVGSLVITYRPIITFFVSSYGGLAIYILIFITPIIVLCLLTCYYQHHPVNYILLAIFTVALAIAVGVSCVFTSGTVILESVILTAVVVVSLTLYTFWAAKRGDEFKFLVPFLFGTFTILIVFIFIQIFFPMGRILTMIYGCLGAIICCAYIIYDTDKLIKRFTYDEYIWAAIFLYVDILKLSAMLMRILKAANCR